jgi:predicted nicotinamide N-methyase
MSHYLIDNWDQIKSRSVLELGAGVGLAGLIASKLPGTKQVVLTDYDHGSLQLLKDNIDLNETATG